MTTQEKRHTVNRLAHRAEYDRDSIYSVLDSVPLGHVGFVQDGQPFVIPMVVWRVGDHACIHSATKGRLATACANAEVCISLAQMDALVLGRSAFNHSMNYRSLVIHGVAQVVEDPKAKLAALETLVERLYPGRWSELRPTKSNELRSTTLLQVPLTQAAVKVRSGMPGDEDEDPDWRVWTGIVPILAHRGKPIDDPTMPEGLSLPSYLVPCSGSDAESPIV